MIWLALRAQWGHLDESTRGAESLALKTPIRPKSCFLQIGSLAAYRGGS